MDLGPKRHFTQRPFFIPGVLVLLTALAFLPALWGDFVDWDDRLMIADNKILLPGSGWSFLVTWNGPYLDLYAPLTYTAYAALTGLGQLFTGHSMPAIIHAASLLLHLTAGCLVFRLLLLICRSRYGAAVGAGLWMLHPIQTEAVVWMSSLNTVLCGTLVIASLLLASESNRPERRAKRHYWFAAACFTFLLALFAKPAAMGFPLALFALDVFVFKRPWKIAAVRAAVWVAIAIPFALVATTAQPALAVVDRPIHERLMIVGHVFAFYAYQILVPIGFVIDYGMNPNYVIDHRWLRWSGLALLPIVAVVFWQARKRPWVLAAALVFIAGVAPVSGVVRFVFQIYSSVADRYVYVAMVGVAIVIAFAASRVRRPLVRVAVAVLLLTPLAVLTCRQTFYWRSTDTLLNGTLKVNPVSLAANATLGFKAQRQGDLVTAERNYRRVIERVPRHYYIRYNLGNILLRTGRPQEAIEEYQAAIAINGDNPNGLNNLGAAYVKTNRPDLALDAYYRAIQGDPEYADAYLNAGYLEANRGRFQVAYDLFRKCLALDPSNQRAKQALQQLTGQPH